MSAEEELAERVAALDDATREELFRMLVRLQPIMDALAPEDVPDS